jgi:serine/threonine-protein kinase
VKRRRQAIADVRVEIEAILADPQGLKFQLRQEPRPLWRRALPIVATAIVIAALTAALMWSLRPRSEPQRIMRFPFALPEGQRLTRFGRHMITISPDGTNTVYVANQQLYLRPLSEIESRPIQGTALDVDTPFFSPDGRWVAFHSNAEARFKKIAITGGASVTICEASLPFGASWTSDGHILIGEGPGGILRVNENGGKPDTIVSVKSDEQAHGPQLLPDGDSILFTLTKGNTGAERWDKAQIVVHSLKSGQRKVLLEGGSDARYLPTGNIVYALGATLLAVPFDLKHLKVTGGPVPIVEGVLRSGTATGAANFSFSNDGTLVYIPGGVPNAAGARSLVLVDRNGARKPLPVPPGSYFQPRFSPSGKQLAVSSDDGKEVFVSVYDLTGTGSMRRLTFGGANRFPLWSRDGQHIVFQSDREKDLALFWQRADGNGTVQRLTRPESNLNHVPDSWADDGKTLIFSVGGVDPSIWAVGVDRDSKANVLIDARASVQNYSSVSPDGHWIAYTSGESGGTPNIFVQPYPPTRAQFQLTTDTSLFPIWSPDGKQIFFVQNRGGTGDLWSIDVQTKPGFTFGKPTALPIKNIIINGGQGNPRGYDIGPDGKFVVMVPAVDNQASQQTQQIFTTLHWFEEVKQKFAGN